ncbi:MAG: tetratricopeptide repeat protein [Pirellulales bacterium]|nr:tetratricopeptide repeat protein [Pirellulales bacterium]
MSQSPERAEDENNPDYRRGWAKIFQMIRSGSSWSGHERNCAYLNTGDGNFANVSVASGVDFPDDGRGLAFGDWDHDGDLDFWISNRTAPRLRFMRNEQPNNNHYMSFRLLGNGKTTNRDAIGARVEVFTKGTAQRPIAKTLRAGEGFLSQNSKWVHFGLGDATEIDRVVVHWPGGEQEVFENVVLDARQVLAQGSGKSAPIDDRPAELALVAKDQTPLPYSDRAALRLITPFETPRLPYLDWDGQKKQVDTQNGKPKLINLWASWCLPCLQELQDFSRNREKIDQAGLEILALSVDGLNDNRSTDKDAKQQIEKMAFPFSTGRATVPLLNALQSIHDVQTPVRRPLPLPTSFLIDNKGRLISIYKGPVSVDELLDDLEAANETPDERYHRAAILAGRTLDGEPATAALEAMDALRYRKFADFFQRLRQKEFALQQLQHIVDIWPESSGVRTELASALLQAGQHATAVAELKEAVQADPNYLPARAALAELLLKQTRLDEAIQHFDKAIALDPDNPKLIYSRGVALHALGKPREAIEDFTRVTQLDPNVLIVFNRRGTLLETIGNYKDAEADFRHAIKQNARDAQAYNNLAWLQATCPDPTFRNGERSLANAKKALALFANENYFVLDTLAAAHAELGQFDEAIELQQKAVGKAPPQATSPLQSRLQLYRSKQPYRQTIDP